jgi:hypothetical protein
VECVFWDFLLGDGAVCGGGGGGGGGLVEVGLDLGAKKREIICCFCLPMVVEVVV